MAPDPKKPERPRTDPDTNDPKLPDRSREQHRDDRDRDEDEGQTGRTATPKTEREP